MPTIVTISGTSRPDNYTAHALALVNDELRNLGIMPTEFDARRMTLAFPGQAPTEDGEALKAAVEGADGIVLATPEYHGGFSAMTKLIIENMGFPSMMAKKPVALVGVAAGRIGAIKSLEQLRAVCAHTGAIVLPGSVSVAGVRGAFDAEGNCTDEATEKALRGVAGALMEFIDDYVCPKYALEQMVRGGGTPWAATV
jgi:NAD(P)H-dependent FMN reductase